ncbi:MAG: response regulator receiver domain [Rhodospirillaceae bacterium]|nr:response regulator receiver domain [Rhodospirillaceae bacterium]
MGLEGEIEMKPANFKEYGKTAARKFLRTAIVIDDDISAPAEANDAKVLEPPPFLVANNIEKRATREEKPAPTSKSGIDSPTSLSDVPIKPLADAFLDKQIVCGVLKPTKTDETKTIVERAVHAALVADIVIIDWYLRAGDESLALSILAEILQKDRKSKGRLRLIMIYTSAVPLDKRRDALVRHLAGQNIDCKCDEGEELVLQADNCRIKFVQKKDGDKGEVVDALPSLGPVDKGR